MPILAVMRMSLFLWGGLCFQRTAQVLGDIWDFFLAHIAEFAPKPGGALCVHPVGKWGKPLSDQEIAGPPKNQAPCP